MCTLHACIEDDDDVHFIMDSCPGGDGLEYLIDHLETKGTTSKYSQR